jgi:hypothetical protein
VVAPLLGAARDAELVLGPGYRATRMLTVAHGRVVTVLPRHLPSGTWTVSARDLTGVTLTPGSRTLSGAATVRIGVFQVTRHGA